MLLPVLGWYVPVAQGVFVLPSHFEPAGQATQNLAALLATPAVALFVSDGKLPEVQVVQFAAPALEYVPVPQLLQPMAPAAEEVPAPHCVLLEAVQE